MSRLARVALVPALFAAATVANAQSAGYASGQSSSATQYDTARIVSVTPVYGGYASAPRNCRSDERYGNAGYGNDGYYRNSGYGNNGYYGNGNDGYRNDGYYGNGYGNGYPDNGYQRDTGSGTGRVVAGVVGSVVGAVLGSQVGGGSGRYIGTAIGSAVGGAAGAGVYDNMQRQRAAEQRRGHVAVCDMEPVNGYANGGNTTQAYDVSYVYGGRTYTSRMAYRPQGDTLRVRVDVQPQ